MHESSFIKFGRRRINTAQIKAVDEEADGSGLLHYVGGGNEPIAADDLEMFLEWADGCCVKTPKADAKRKAAADAKEKARADAEKAAEAEAKAAEKAAHEAHHAHHAKK